MSSRHVQATAERPRIQTFRQARRAYLRSNHSITFSETELRQIQRRGELQERAQRIREQEKKRCEARERRQRKVEKERARRQTGGPDGRRDEPLIHGLRTIPQSQERLTRFWSVGGRQDSCECEDESKGATEPRAATDTASPEPEEAAPTPSPGRTLEKIRSPLTQRVCPAGRAEAQLCTGSMRDLEDWDKLFPSYTQVEREISCEQSPTPPVARMSSVSSRAEADEYDEALGLLSTQELEITLDDLEDIENPRARPDQSPAPAAEMQGRETRDENEEEADLPVRAGPGSDRGQPTSSPTKWDESFTTDEILALLGP